MKTMYAVFDSENMIMENTITEDVKKAIEFCVKNWSEDEFNEYGFELWGYEEDDRGFIEMFKSQINPWD